MTAFTWVGGSSSNWADPENWTPAGYPTLAGDTATIDATGTYTVSVNSGETDTINSLTLNAAGATLSINGTLAFGGANAVSIDAGTLALGSTGNITGFPDLTVAAGATFDVSNSANQTIGSLSGSGSVLLGTHTLTIGADNVSTTFSGTVQGGATFDEGALVHGGTGTLTLDNATMTNNELIIATGNLAVNDGTNQLFYFALGEGTGNSGSATISGGILNIGGTSPTTLTSALQVGDFGGTGLVTQTAGTMNVTGSFNIGNQGGKGTYDLMGGTVNLLAGLYNVGRNANGNPAGTGTINVSGGLFDIQGGSLILGNFYPNSETNGQSSGRMVQTGGTVLAGSSSAIYMASLGNGEYDLDGGTLEVGGTGLANHYQGGSGTGTFHMGGGTLAVTGANLTTDVQVVLDTGTDSTLSLGALNASFSGAVTGAGTLDISGSRTTSFSALNATGTLELQGGTVDITNTGAIGQIDVDAGVLSALAINAGTLTINNGIAGNLDVTVAAGATLDVSNITNPVLGSLAGSGTVLVGSQTLVIGVDGGSTTFSGTLQGAAQDTGQVEQIGTGTLTLDNATMNAGELLVGNGNLAVGAGTNQLFYLAIGEGTGSSGSATISGGILNIGSTGTNLGTSSALQVGDFGGTGLVTQTAGTVNIIGSFNIGNQGGTGTYDLMGGTINLVVGLYDVGRNSGGNAAGSGTVNVSGGLLDIQSSNFVLGNLQTNTGTHGQASGLLVQTGGVVSVEAGSAIYMSSKGNGEYDLDGGMLKVGGAGLQNSYNGGGGTGALHMGGGTLAVTGSSLTANANIILNSGTDSTLSLGALNASFSGTVTGAGTLDISGSGTTSFSALNAAGTLELQGATVDITNTGAIGQIDVDAGTSSTLAINAGTLTVNNGISGNLDVTVAAGATLDVSNITNPVLGSLAGSGTVLVGSQTLVIDVDGGSTTFSGTLQGAAQDTGQVEQIGTGTLTLDNATMNDGELLVGNGKLAVSAGTNQLFYLAVGEGAGSSGNATISGGVLNIGTIGANPNTLNSALQVGDFGGTGLVTQTGGTVNITGSLNLGNQGGTGTYDLQNGTINLLAGLYDFGRNSGGNAPGSGTLDVSGGLFDIKAGHFVLGNLYTNSGTLGQGHGLVIQTGGTVLIEGSSEIFLSAKGNGEYDLDGGTLEVGGAGLQKSYNNGGGTGALHMGGGTLAVTGASLTTNANIILDSGTDSTLSLGALGASFSGTVTGAGNLEISGTSTAAFATLGGTGTVTIGTGSTLSVTGAVGSGETIAFGGTGGTLSLGAPGSFAGAITGFGAGDQIDLTSLTFINGSTAVLDAATGILTVTEGTTSFTRHLVGDFTGQFFHVANDGHGGTIITENDVPCYCSGTRILTADGEVAVETLRIGHYVVTVEGESLPIKWIGRRNYRDWLAVGNSEVQPILFKAGSLADGVPARDLLVSPEHAMFLDGMLVPAQYLVNGTSILKVEGMEEIEYFHLEFDRHVVIFAEGAAAESFADDDSRMLFHNAGEYRHLYPGEPSGRITEYCAPRVEAGAALDALQRKLATRATHLRPGGTAAPWGRRGKVELATRTLVSGWAFSGADAGPIALAILVNGAVVGRTVADRHRPDLEAAGIGDGGHGFRFKLPSGLPRNTNHQIEVRRETDWSLLHAGYVTIEPEFTARE